MSINLITAIDPVPLNEQLYYVNDSSRTLCEGSSFYCFFGNIHSPAEQSYLPVAVKQRKVNTEQDALVAEAAKLSAIHAFLSESPYFVTYYGSWDKYHFIERLSLDLSQIIALNGTNTLTNEMYTNRHYQSWIRSILDAMVFLHNRNVAHRDIKPANCFIKENGDLVLGDYDLIISADEENARVVAGTAEYCAPEVFEAIAKGHYSIETSPTALDLWSAGVTIDQISKSLIYPNQSTPWALYIARAQEANFGSLAEQTRKIFTYMNTISNVINDVEALGLMRINPLERTSAQQALALFNSLT